MTDFQRKFEQIKSQVIQERAAETKPTDSEPEVKVQAIGSHELAKQEFKEALDDFKQAWATEIKIAKWFIIGGLLVLNIISFTVFKEWNGFLMSPEYQLYKARVDNAQ